MILIYLTTDLSYVFLFVFITSRLTMRMCIFIIANITILYETRAVDHCYSNGAKYVTRCSATCSEFVEIFNDVFTSPLVESEGERTLKIVQNMAKLWARISLSKIVKFVCLHSIY